MTKNTTDKRRFSIIVHDDACVYTPNTHMHITKAFRVKAYTAPYGFYQFTVKGTTYKVDYKDVTVEHEITQ